MWSLKHRWTLHALHSWIEHHTIRLIWVEILWWHSLPPNDLLWIHVGPPHHLVLLHLLWVPHTLCHLVVGAHWYHLLHVLAVKIRVGWWLSHLNYWLILLLLLHLLLLLLLLLLLADVLIVLSFDCTHWPLSSPLHITRPLLYLQKGSSQAFWLITSLALVHFQIWLLDFKWAVSAPLKLEVVGFDPTNVYIWIWLLC